MPSDSSINMVNAALDKNAVDFKSHLEASMNERIASELRDKKTEIASSMFKEANSKDSQQVNLMRKKKESAEDQNDIAMKGSSPAKGM